MNEDIKTEDVVPADNWVDPPATSEDKPAVETQEAEPLDYVASLVAEGEDIKELHEKGFLADDEYKAYLASQEEKQKTSAPVVEDVKVGEDAKQGTVADETVPVKLSKEEVDALKASSQNWENWVKEFSADPVKAVAAIVGNPNAFTPEQRAQLAGYVGSTAPAPRVDVSKIEATSEYEAVALPHTAWVTDGRKEVEAAFGQVSQTFKDMYVEQETTKATMKELARLFNITLPELDLKEVYKPGTEISKNIETLYTTKVKAEIDKAIQLRKAASNPKPNTPTKTASGGTPKLGKPMTIQDSLRQVEAMLAAGN